MHISDIVVLLDRLDSMRQQPSPVPQEEWDELAELFRGAILHRVENRVQLERLLTGMPNDTELIERADRLLSIHVYEKGAQRLDTVDMTDQQLQSRATAFVGGFVQYLRQAGRDSLADRLEVLPVAVIDERPLGWNPPSVVGTNGRTEATATAGLTDEDLNSLRDEELRWPSMIGETDKWSGHFEPWWDCVYAAFDEPFVEPNRYLDEWMTGPLSHRKEAVEAVFELWSADAALCIEGNRVAVVRGAAEGIAGFGDIHYVSRRVATDHEPTRAMKSWLSDAGPNGRRISELFATAASAPTPTVVTLRGLGVTTLPPIDSPTFVRWLRLEDDPYLGSLAGIEHFTQLESLSIVDCALDELPPGLTQLNLTRLSLENTTLESIPDWLGELTTLTELDLSRRTKDSEPKLTELPTSLAGLTLLETVLVPHNSLSALPTAVHNWTSLRVLIVNNNKIASLPEWIGDLKHLTTLELQGNPISALPDEIGQLASLRDLRLDDTELRTLPTSILDLPDDCKINLWGTNLPPALQNATTIADLHEHFPPQ